MRTSGDILQDIKDVKEEYANDDISDEDFVEQYNALKEELCAYKANNHRGPEYH